MKWRDPMPIVCPVCGGRHSVPVKALRSLRAVCPGCGVSLTAIGERMIAEEARVRQRVNFIRVGHELSELYGLPDDETDAARTLGDLIRLIAKHLGPGVGSEARATEIVLETARRVAPALLKEAGPTGQPRPDVDLD